MTWSALESTIRTFVASLDGDLPNLIWNIQAVDQPDGVHVLFAILTQAVTPLEIGANLSEDGDRTEGTVQFDIYSPAGRTIDEAKSAADTIRSAMRGRRLERCYFTTPRFSYQGREGAFHRWTVDCPFVAEEI